VEWCGAATCQPVAIHPNTSHLHPCVRECVSECVCGIDQFWGGGGRGASDLVAHTEPFTQVNRGRELGGGGGVVFDAPRKRYVFAESPSG
jgi:hypothetical protein